MAVNHCGDCRFFVTIQGAREQRQGCIAGIRKIGAWRSGCPAMIHVMELLRSEGRDGLDRILEKGNLGARACEMWLPRHQM